MADNSWPGYQTSLQMLYSEPVCFPLWFDLFPPLSFPHMLYSLIISQSMRSPVFPVLREIGTSQFPSGFNSMQFPSTPFWNSLLGHFAVLLVLKALGMLWCFALCFKKILYWIDLIITEYLYILIHVASWQSSPINSF